MSKSTKHCRRERDKEKKGGGEEESLGEFLNRGQRMNDRRKSTPEIGSWEVERPRSAHRYRTRLRSPTRGIPARSRSGRNLERAKNPCRARGEGDRDGYAPGKRWSPSTVGRKRKYWDWLSPVHGTEVRLSVRKRACPRRGSFPSPSPSPPPPPPSRGGDKIPPLTRREPRCAIHFCPLTSPFPRLPLPRGFKDSIRRNGESPSANNTGSAPTTPLSLSLSLSRRNYSQIVFSLPRKV